MMRLAIDEIKDNFLKALDNQRPIVLQAPTGSGKSTRIPLWLLEHYQKTIIVLEPRRVACLSLANYVSKLMGEKCGESVGYQVRFDSKIGSKTRLIFMTPGLFLRRISNNDFFKKLDCVFFDEFHERQWQNDLNIAFLMKQVERPKVIVGSATLETSFLTQKLDAIELRSTSRNYSVEISYDEEVSSPSRYHLSERVSRVVERALKTTGGDILVFLPGLSEIRKAQSLLKGNSSILVFIVHGSVNTKELDQILNQREDRNNDKKYVYLASNIAESSLTIPGITLVIDSGLEKRVLHRQQKTILALTSCAKSSMMQRAGRAGRTQKGQCIRLFSQKFQPEKQRPPEIEQMNMHALLFSSAFLGLKVTDLIQLPWISKPPSFAVERALLELKRLGMLDDKSELNSAGHKASASPFEPILSYYIEKAPQHLRYLASWVLVFSEKRLGLLNSLENIRDMTQKNEVIRLRRDCLKGSQSYFEQEMRLLVAPNWKELKMDDKLYHEAHQLFDRICSHFWDSSILAFSHKITPELVFEVGQYFAECQSEYLYLLRRRVQKKMNKSQPKYQSFPYGNGYEELQVATYTPYLEDKAIVHEAALCFSAFYHENHKGVIVGQVSWCIPCRMNDLKKMQIGDYEIEQPQLVKKNKKLDVVANVKQSFAGTIINEEKQSLRGDKLEEALFLLLKSNQWLKGTYLLSEELYYQYNLFVEIYSKDMKEECPDFGVGIDDYLKGQIKDLGISSSEEIGIIEGEDLLFCVPSIVAYHIDFLALQKDFPRYVTYGQTTFQAEVFYFRKNICLTPVKGYNKKKYRDPKAFELPRFRFFSVDLKKASRKQRLR